ncbi:MAG: ABC transporter permease [Hydrogenophaga sp.]|uniref:ABC transporter permease n=1 Tax=Hydrogenophaga sp. TaxID=1904254 RepID=UPI001D3976B7|nr:ABC transporter permease [Hydrogenophaga sp.]MBX3609608.1 ABC transporter permease [Hydrogenophaga sp.]
MNATQRTHTSGATPALRRLRALVRKESLQILRDPSALLIAFVLPVLLLFLFAYAVSLDIRRVPIGVVLEADGPAAQSLAAAFAATRYFEVHPARDRRELAEAVASGHLKGYVVIPADLPQRMAHTGTQPWVQVITDGAQPNSAGFVARYAQGVVSGWALAQGMAPAQRVNVQPRFWFNAEIESRRYLVPGAIAIVMTMIGTLLTALVVAREWERGTMEALLSTPARVSEILLGKLLPYVGLGLVAAMMASALAVGVFGLPLVGSWWAVLLVSAVFMLPALGQGLLISALARNQFIAAQFALFTGFLPAFLLSGFLFEIAAMPAPLRALTWLVPARYYIEALQTLFLSGNEWSVLGPNLLAMALIGAVLLALARAKTRKDLAP